MSSLTLYLARLFGLLTILLVGGLFFRGPAVIDASVSNAPLMFTYGIISLAIGLAMVLGHNVWFGGVLPVVVTLMGWLILAKGAILILLPAGAFSGIYGSLDFGAHMYLYLAPSFLLGLYLTWAGFTAKTQK
jgi:hypothetical protein